MLQGGGAALSLAIKGFVVVVVVFFCLVFKLTTRGFPGPSVQACISSPNSRRFVGDVVFVT